jgi:hypothetical protein
MAHESCDERVRRLEDALVRVGATAPAELLGDLVGTATMFALKLNARARALSHGEEEAAAMEAVRAASAACKELLADHARANGAPKRKWARRF